MAAYLGMHIGQGGHDLKTGKITPNTVTEFKKKSFSFANKDFNVNTQHHRLKYPSILYYLQLNRKYSHK